VQYLDHGGRKERRLKHEPAKTRKYNGLFAWFRPVSGSYSNKLRVVNHPIKRGLASAATQAKPIRSQSLQSKGRDIITFVFVPCNYKK